MGQWLLGGREGTGGTVGAGVTEGAGGTVNAGWDSECWVGQ